MENTNAATLVLDGEKISTMRSFYTEIDKKLRLPEHFGHNLDALLDCLCDLAHLEKKQITIQILAPKKFLNKVKSGTRAAVWEIFEEAALPENRYDEVLFKVETMEKP